MKKLLAVVLTLALTMGMSTVAFADDAAGQDPNPNYGKLVKVYQLDAEKTLEDSVAPAETFEFTFTPYKMLDNEYKEKAFDAAKFPVIDGDNRVNIAFTEVGKEVADFPISIENVELGKYYYEVEETVGNTAGLTYNVENEKIFLVVTVERADTVANEPGKFKYTPAFHYEKEDGTKVDQIVNEYAAGHLKVGKRITGNVADMNKKFPFTVTLYAPEKEVVTSTVKVTLNDGTVLNQALSFEGGKAEFKYELGHNDVLKFENLPEGVTYVVTEENGEYKVTEDWSDKEKTIQGGDADTVVFTNDLTKGIDTGVVLDSLPYILVLLAVGAGAVAMVARRKYDEQ